MTTTNFLLTIFAGLVKKTIIIFLALKKPLTFFFVYTNCFKTEKIHAPKTVWVNLGLSE